MMKHSMNRVPALLMALVLSLSLFGCSPAQPAPSTGPVQPGATPAPTNLFPGTAQAGNVSLDIGSDPAELNHMLLADGVAVDPMRHFMSGLTRLDRNDQPVADLAERWEVSEDGTAYTFYLRQDAKWTNGDPVTAQDYYYSWMTQLDPNTGTPFASFLYGNILNAEDYYGGKAQAADVGIQVVDDYTLRVTYNKPMASALYFMSFPTYFPMNQKAYESIGADRYGKSPDTFVSNGPYQLTEWVPSDHITLEKNPDYWNAGALGVPTVKLLMIGDQNTRLNAFLGGQVDVCSLYSDQIDQVKAEDPGAIRSYIDGGSWYLQFNCAGPRLSNVNLRRALAHAVDVQALLDNVIRDGSVAADGLVPGVISGAGGQSYAQARGSLFAYDPEAAKGYLDAALGELGLTADQLALKLIANDTSYSQTQAAFLQQEWKSKLGLDVGIDVMPWKARVDAQAAGDFDMIVTGWGPNENDAITFLEVFPSDSGYNQSGYANPEYDRLIAEAIAEPDAQKRQDLLIAAEKVLMDDMAIGPMYFTSTTYAVSGKVQGLVRTPFQIFSFCDGASVTGG